MTFLLEQEPVARLISALNATGRATPQAVILLHSALNQAAHVPQAEAAALSVREAADRAGLADTLGFNTFAYVMVDSEEVQEHLTGWMQAAVMEEPYNGEAVAARLAAFQPTPRDDGPLIADSEQAITTCLSAAVKGPIGTRAADVDLARADIYAAVVTYLWSRQPQDRRDEAKNSLDAEVAVLETRRDAATAEAARLRAELTQRFWTSDEQMARYFEHPDQRGEGEEDLYTRMQQAETSMYEASVPLPGLDNQRQRIGNGRV